MTFKDLCNEHLDDFIGVGLVYDTGRDWLTNGVYDDYNVLRLRKRQDSRHTRFYVTPSVYYEVMLKEV